MKRLILALVALQLAAAPALQAAPRIMCEPLPEAANGANPPMEFKVLIQKYVRTFSAIDQRVRYLPMIQESVFDFRQADQYAEKLRYLDAQAASAPAAINKAATMLQIHWEVNHGIGEKLLRTKLRGERLEASTQIGAIIGVGVLGASLFYHPENVGRYFALLRYLLPAAGLVAGRAVGDAMNESGRYDRKILTAPARIMRLGIAEEIESHPDADRLYRFWVPATTGVAMSVIALRIATIARGVQAANAAGTIFKVNPLVLVGSFALGYAVQAGAEEAIDFIEFSRLKDAVQAARKAVDDAVRMKDDGRLYAAADRLVYAVTTLAAYSTLEMRDAFLSGDHEQLIALSNHLSRDRNALHDEFLVRNLLREHSEEAIQLLRDRTRYVAEAYQLSFTRWLAAHENAAAQSLDPDARQDLLIEFVNGIGHVKDRALAAEFRAGKISRDVNRLVLQASAFLREFRSPMVQGQADALMALAVRPDISVASEGNSP